VRVAIQNGLILPILLAAFIGSLAAMDGVSRDGIVTRVRVSLPRILPMYWKVVPILQVCDTDTTLHWQYIIVLPCLTLDIACSKQSITSPINITIYVNIR
jgi:hypothetical protein